MWKVFTIYSLNLNVIFNHITLNLLSNSQLIQIRLFVLIQEKSLLWNIQEKL